MCTFLNIRSASAKSLAAAFLNICLATVSFAKGPDLVVADIWEQNHQIYFSISNIGQDLCPGGHTAWLFVDAQQVDRMIR